MGLSSTGHSTAKTTWIAALGELELQVPRSTYETWLKDTVGLSVTDQSMVVGVPNAFTAEWLEKRVYHLVRKTVSKIADQPLEVKFLIEGSSQGGPAPNASTNHALKTSVPAPCIPNHRYSFDSFVVGPSNSLSYTAAQAVASSPGQYYNPLFIYSGVGLGKTHLLHAIARSCIERSINYLYVTSEQFTNEFITSIRERTTEEFRSRYRSVDVLLMDDIQFMSGKEQTLEGFFHTFNDLHNANRQVVITSDQSPNTMPYLEDRLRSRFTWGLITDIQYPALETRIAILQARAKEMQVCVNNEALTYVAERVRNSVRDLEGAFNRLVAMAQLTNSPITRDLAEHTLQHPTDAQDYSSLPPDKVLTAVERVFKVDHATLIGSKRQKELVIARQAAMYLLRKCLKLTVTQIGRVLGGKNHATVIYGIKRITANLDTNDALRAQIEATKEELLNQSRQR